MQATGKMKKIILGILLIALGLLLLIGLIRFGSLLAFLYIFSRISELLTVSLGLNEWLAKIIAFAPAVFFTVGTGYLLTFNRARFQRGLILCSIGYLAICIFMYSVNARHAYNPISGKATKCYAAGFSGYEEISCEWKFHPQTRSPVITDPEQIKEVVRSLAVTENPPQVGQRVKLTKNIRFFSVDGTPLVWYYQHPDGKIELFSTSGHHPLLNTILQPINSEIAKLLLNPKNRYEADRIIFAEETATGDSEGKTALKIYQDHLIKTIEQLNN
ncbi:MAG: hypothetical protein AAB575_02990 [Patescibacteria group bacterium]